MPRELLERGDSIEFAELMAYFQIQTEEHEGGRKGRKGKTPLEYKDIPYQR